jgi:exodeoxyribonuclease VII large subunit
MAGQLDLALGPGRPVALSVTQFVRMVREALEERLDGCWVRGEISNFRAAPSNHLYFTLKDANAAINVVMFSSAGRNLRFRPADGMQVLVHGRVNVYETRGTLQFYADEMEPQGVGALQVAFEQLKKRLECEGLFDSARKRPLPFMPRTVGIVSALGGAGLRDILRVMLERFPNLHVVVRPVRVQGDGAAFEIAGAIGDLNRDGRAEVIIVGRGGGSLEDLWAFNEEAVARAIYQSRIPIVSAVGHEIDYTIADFVADRRAPTPTFAAQMVVPMKSDMREQIAVLEQALRTAMRKELAALAGGVAHLAARVKHPRNLLRDARQHLDEASGDLMRTIRTRVLDSRRHLRELAGRLRPPTCAVREMRLRAHGLSSAMGHAMGRRAGVLRVRLERVSATLVRAVATAADARRRRLASLTTRLDSISPLKCLERGYAVVVSARDGRTVADAASVQVGDELHIRLRRGRLTARTERREP